MKIDMHVHTSKYSSCAKMTPEQMVQGAIASGMDGVVITEHNYLWTMEEIKELQVKYPQLKILRGIEVSTDQGHFLVYGINSAHSFFKGMPFVELVRCVHELKGIIVIAHPCRYSDTIAKEILEIPLDGIEVMSTNVLTYMKDAIQIIQDYHKIPGICGTDAHNIESLGIFATDFKVSIRTEQDMIMAIRNRDFTLYRNHKKIEAINANIDEKIAIAKEIISTGLSPEKIKAKYNISHSFQYGVKNNKDMHLL